MSNVLEKKFALNDVRVQKAATGEVMLHFNNQELPDLVISHNTVIDLLKIANVTVAELKNSNLKSHIQQGCLNIIN